MSIIRQLPPEVASRIAAGEVIERPASVLKEVIENSLDAGATRVDIEVLSAGRGLLRVSDDGLGMDAQDCRAALERHATSKISSLEDIDSLSTFGFRGEALFSIAAVSRITLVSTPRGTRLGWKVEAHGGKIVQDHEAPPVAGTCVEVRDIFYNTPARAKFLKSEASERGHLLRVVEEAALANPGVTFGYKSENRKVVRFAGRGAGQSAPEEGGARERIADVLGREIGDGLLYAAQKRAGLDLRAFISPADSLKPTRALQFFLVNRRPVNSRLLQQALYRAYEPFRAQSRHPAAVLYLELPPDRMDVNVHPTKREVRFRSEQEIFEAVTAALSRALLQSKGIPTLSPRRVPTPYPAEARDRVSGSLVREAIARYPSGAREEGPALLASEAGSPAAEPAPTVQTRPWFDPELRFLGQIERSYLVFDASGGMLVVDQHAAQERVLFERYLKQVEAGSPAAQKLMLPVPVELPASSIQRVLTRQDRLKRAGFEVEPFGKTMLHVTSVPQIFHKDEDIKELVLRLLDGLLSPGAAAADAKYDAAATIACKAAVKAHDLLGEKEALRLVADLKACSDGTCCPHGRPTMLSLSRDELARRFKRPGAPPL